MDLALEANRNSALFQTFQTVLDRYNPLVHKARPTVVNQTKHRIPTPPTSWENTMSRWNGAQNVRFDIPRIGSLVDCTVKAAFKLPGSAPSSTAIRNPDVSDRRLTGDRGFASTGLTLGTITDNGNTTTNNARGRLDRVYADRLLGFNMIKSYTVSSKSRRIFSASGEYLLVRFAQMDEDMKRSVEEATTPVNILASNALDTFYTPGISYFVTIPLFMFFNEHITNALDVNFSEEIHIDIELRPPSQLFYYGQLGDLSQVPAACVTGEFGAHQIFGSTVNATASQITTASGKITMDQFDSTVYAADVSAQINEIEDMVGYTLKHIQGILQPFADMTTLFGAAPFDDATSGATFAYPDVDSLGQSLEAQFSMNCDYIVQDSDAYRALRKEMFPDGKGLTTITYDTAQEVFQNIMGGANTATLLDEMSGGTFTDPSQSQTGLTVGDSVRYIDLQLRSNNLAFATHFMVRKHSDMGGDRNSNPSAAVNAAATTNVLGAHRIYTRALPIHGFQLMAAGRTLYESDGKSQHNLTQTGLYNGSGTMWGTRGETSENHYTGLQASNRAREGGRPFNVYSIVHGLEASRLENTGCLSYQNLNGLTLRIYFKPDQWAEYNNQLNSASTPVSNAQAAAALGVQIDVIHEHFNIITVNSGNGEITSGLNQ